MGGGGVISLPADRNLTERVGHHQIDCEIGSQLFIENVNTECGRTRDQVVYRISQVSGLDVTGAMSCLERLPYYVTPSPSCQGRVFFMLSVCNVCEGGGGGSL